MKTIAVALGLAEDANEASCLASLNTRLQTSVAKDVHDATLAQLQATSTELTTLKAAGREKRVTDLIEGALTAKKILPAEKEHFTALCSTDAGIETVEKLFAAKTPVLTGSDLDQRQAGDGQGEQDPVKLAAAAAVYQKKMADAGMVIAFSDAVMAVKEGKK